MPPRSPRRRSSAGGAAPRTSIGAGQSPAAIFYPCSTKPAPATGSAPFDVGLGEPALHLLIFVHHIENLQPGLYFFSRNDQDLPEVRGLARPEFTWEPVEPGFPLFLLKPGNFRQTASPG